MVDLTSRKIRDSFELDIGTLSGSMYLFSEFPLVINPAGQSGPQVATLDIYHRVTATPKNSWVKIATDVPFRQRIYLGDAAQLHSNEFYLYLAIARSDDRSAAPYRIIHSFRDSSGNRLSVKPASGAAIAQIEQSGIVDVDAIEHSSKVILK